MQSDWKLTTIKNESKLEKEKYSLENPSEKMKQILKDNIMEELLPLTLLIEGVPESFNEEHIRNILIKEIMEKYHFQPSEIGRIDYFSNFSVYRIVMSSVSECDLLVGKSVVIKDKEYSLYRPPLQIPDIKEINTQKRSTRKSTSSKKRRLLDDGNEIPTSQVKKKKVLKKEENVGIEDGEYVISSVLEQNWSKNNVQLVVKLNGIENRTFKILVEDENILKLFELNKKYRAQDEMLSIPESIDPDEFPKIDEVISADKKNGQLFLWVKWMNCDVKSLLPASAVNIISPEKVIEFYEGKLVFEDKQ